MPSFIERIPDMSDDAIQSALNFAVRIHECRPNKDLPAHLQKQEDALKAEQLRRITNLEGDGI